MTPYCSFIKILHELGLTPKIDRQDHDEEGSVDISMHLCCGQKGICSISVWDLKENEIWNPICDFQNNQKVSATDPLAVSHQVDQVSRQFGVNNY